MRFLNLVANNAMSLIFSWLLSRRMTDTLCLLRRSDDERLGRAAAAFGEFDPFGNFFLVFGAAKLNLAPAEVEIRQAGRLYGEPWISRFRHGLLLVRILWFAFRIKAL